MHHAALLVNLNISPSLIRGIARYLEIIAKITFWLDEKARILGSRSTIIATSSCASPVVSTAKVCEKAAAHPI